MTGPNFHFNDEPLNCIFCQKRCTQEPNDAFDLCLNCGDHGWNARFLWFGLASDPDLSYYTLTKDNLRIEVAMDDRATRFFQDSKPSDDLSVWKKLTELPLEKISPSNADYWMDKILKLKPFL